MPIGEHKYRRYHLPRIAPNFWQEFGQLIRRYKANLINFDYFGSYDSWWFLLKTLIQFDKHIFQMGWNHQLVVFTDPNLSWKQHPNQQRGGNEISGPTAVGAVPRCQAFKDAGDDSTMGRRKPWRLTDLNLRCGAGDWWCDGNGVEGISHP